MSEYGTNLHLKKDTPCKNRVRYGPLTLRGYNLKNTEYFFILKNKSRKNAIKLDKHETNFQIFPGPPNQGCLYYFIFILPDFVPT